MQQQQQQPQPVLQDLNVANVQNIIGNVGPAPSLATFQQITIDQLNANYAQLQTQFNQLQVNYGLLQAQNIHLQNQIDSLRQGNTQLKLDLKHMLAKLKQQDNPSERRVDGTGDDDGTQVKPARSHMEIYDQNTVSCNTARIRTPCSSIWVLVVLQVFADGCEG